jgi:iron complex transport system ATP-binding protein
MSRSSAPVLRGGESILSNFNWQVEPGQHWAILGANGSGKTTLLRTLAGYFAATEGDIDVLGNTFGEHDWRDLRKRVGVVSSAVREMMAMEERPIESIISGKTAALDYRERLTESDEKEALRMLRRLECEDLAWRPWAFLSQGERQRVLIGRALMASPALLILDEPCAGLDPAARERFLFFIENLCSRKRCPTVLFVTHHVEEIMPSITHALVMKAGRVIAEGPKHSALTSRILSEAFDAQIAIRRSKDRYSLTVETTGRNRVL